MNKPPQTLEVVGFQPAQAIVVEKTEPAIGRGQNIAFAGVLEVDQSTDVGQIGGIFEKGWYGDIDDIYIYPQWRGNQFASQLFMHFIQHAIDGQAQAISMSAANERSAHLMGKIPNVKQYSFSQNGRSASHITTIEQAVAELQAQRLREHPKNPDNTETLEKTTIRITADL